jgi:transcriptional regulator with XRE-family HTH domain
VHDCTSQVKEEMQDSLTWRELLGKILQDPHERARIAAEMGVDPLTLTRWVHGESNPRVQNLQALLRALPEYHKEFLALIPKEFGPLLDETTLKEDALQEIPSAFYDRILHAFAELPATLRFWSICDLILQQALQQLDPNRVGMEISLVRCMPPVQGQKVRSLRESVGRGTPPWTREFQQKTLFLGAESLAGYAVTTGRSISIQMRE